MKIVTLILAKNISINSKIIAQVGKLARKHLPAKSFQRIGILVDYRDNDNPLAVAEIIKQVTAPKKDNTFLINDSAFGKDNATELATGLVPWINDQQVKNRDFVIIIANGNRNFAPNQIVSHISEATLGKNFDFTPIFAQ